MRSLEVNVRSDATDTMYSASPCSQTKLEIPPVELGTDKNTAAVNMGAERRISAMASKQRL